MRFSLSRVFNMKYQYWYLCKDSWIELRCNLANYEEILQNLLFNTLKKKNDLY
jgi:hypothetical protein